jgi:proline dehydrogenase
LQRAGRAYVGGATLEDGLCVARRLAVEDRPSTIGLWDTPEYVPRRVANEYLAGIEALSAGSSDTYLSIKPPALRFDHGLAAELATAAHARSVRLHLDSHGLDAADPSRALLEAMLSKLSCHQLSTTLPGRWARSVPDAAWAADLGLQVRVVKGQWPDPADPDRDLRDGFLEVIDRLAGRARRVLVASHDVPLAAEAVRRLREAGTPCELELLFCLPMKRSLRWAAANGVRVRIYVPYGEGFVPHALGQLRRNPRLAWSLVRSLVHPVSAGESAR